ncbi:ribonuclease D [Paraperlucidibaca baekdonensis]|uniref:Ribonuclease D n=1 Tax=Paraperlucidibaca baekdonensis TaxID=748120 RepID=A0A3E0H338_9GAMM|nr:HRDC domain-containing protein [Paraperlucidibaca baekdonensis]REH36918.1 ribonuclease D [Paraperlucidibaca baekdonensis]
MPEYSLITAANALAESLPRWQRAEPLAIDTEFIRVDTFYPKLGLLQLGDGLGEILVDPVAIPDISCLAPLLGANGPLKIMHACSEDLEVLTPYSDGPVAGVHDTQIALAMLGEGLQLGYQKALAQILHIDIPKDASRSNWLARPLSEQQLNYAALDVRHLPALYEVLRERLQAKDLWAIYEAECAEVCRLSPPADPQQLWREHGNAWRLSRQQSAVLQALMQWRETQAMQRDVPRGHLLKPLSLFEMAVNPPQHSADFRGISELNPRVARKDGDALIELMHAARADESTWPTPVPAPLPREASKLFDTLKRAMQPLAERLGMPIEVLWRKRLAERVIIQAVDVSIACALDQLSGWRVPYVSPIIADVLSRHQPLLDDWSAQRLASMKSR